MLLYGKDPPNLHGLSQHAYDSLSYPATLQARLAELQDFVHANITQAAASQKSSYDQHTRLPFFKQGQSVWLSVPTAGKLDPKWEGEWAVKSVKSPVSIEIYDGKHTKIVHVNRLRHHCVPGLKNTNTTARRDDEADSGMRDDWSPPGIEHLMVPAADEGVSEPCYP